MKIALLAPIEERVPPKRYGATELLVYYLADEFLRLGHKVTVLASGDSDVPGRLIPLAPKAIGSGIKKRVREALGYQSLVKATQFFQQEKFDIIHNHAGWQALLFKDLFKHPILTTIHAMLRDNECDQKMYGMFKDMPFASISNAQRAQFPGLNYIDTVHHGLQLDHFTFNDHPKNYLAFLGRFSSFKGPAEAIEVAKRTGNKLIMAAKINDYERGYFERELKPHIDGEQIIYLGEVDHAGKVELLKNARAVISPISWPEPFGLVNIEAMACGTPVLTTPMGSTPELIVNGKNGFLCRDLDEMCARVAQIDQIDRRACREYAEKHFSAERMAKQYLGLYEKITKAIAKPSRTAAERLS
jgi:glycosyltransferase involved in cell wall biosynthesis